MKRLLPPLPQRLRATIPAFVSVAASFFCLGGHACADVRLPAIFGDHMVLQRDGVVPIWGWADPGEKVTVEAGADRAEATAGKDGKWSVSLNRLAASGEPIEVTVTGKNKITFTDVLVGDVWVCSGQSNMELGARVVMSGEEIARSNHPGIRLFTVPKWVAPAASDEMAPAPESAPMLGKWSVCTPETLSKNGEWAGFSAVAFLFGREIHQFTGKPVGLIATSWGGTRIHSWMSFETLETLPEKVSATRKAAEFRDNYEAIKTEWETDIWPQYQATLAKWKEENQEAINAHAEAEKEWRQLAREAAAEKRPAPPRPVAPRPPREPRNPLTDNQSSCALFNGMIAPLVPYGIKGAIWYQGESNAAEPVVYRAELPALINDWRDHWKQGDFPFLIVQLPNFGQPQKEPGESTWALTREAQAGALSLPNTGMAVTLDIGDARDIHPRDKQDVAIRLGLVARRVAYGENGVVFSGPTLKEATPGGGKIRITFDHIGSGLTIGRAPDPFYTSRKEPIPTTLPDELEGFAIAGQDGKFVWAKATIEGDTVVVENAAVPYPVSVRYGWADNPTCNLYNKEGLPAAPFRTDDLPAQ